MTMALLRSFAGVSARISPSACWGLAWLGALLIAVFSLPAVANDTLDKEFEFNIPSQSVESALLEFSRQADVQVMVGSSSLAGLRAPALKGRFTVSAALRKLLENTGLMFETVGRTVTVRSVATATIGAATRPLVNAGTLASTDQLQRRSLEKSPDGASDREFGSIKVPDPTIDEVLVTGSHIRGTVPIGAQLITMDRAEIARTGLATVQDVIRTLPQNFGGGPSEDTSVGLEASTNNIKGTAINLRGLGAGATLVLLNGRRLAPSGGEGAFTDVSSIPLTAIDQIDVLPDGASAVYGSDAIGGVVNIKLREEFTGIETFARGGAVTSGGLDEYQFGQSLGLGWGRGSASLSYEYFDRGSLLMKERKLTRTSDLRPFGGADFRDRFNNPGTIIVGNQNWALPSDQNGTDLDPSSLVAGTQNLGNRNEAKDLLSSQTRHSVYVNARQRLTERLAIYGDGLFSRRDVESIGGTLTATLAVPSTNPFYVNPTGGAEPVRVAYSFLDDFGPRSLDVDVRTINAAVGTTLDIANTWQLKFQGSMAVEDVNQAQNGLDSLALNAALADPNPATAFNAFGDGSFTNPDTIARLRGQSKFDTESDLLTVGISAEGALWDMGDERVRLAVGAETRKPRFQSTFTAIGSVSSSRVAFDREISAAYAELVAPLIAPSRNYPALHRLSLALAARHEDYSDFGSATSPKIGVDWWPSSAVKVRATWSEAFKAPNLPDLDEANNVSAIFGTAPDPLSTSGVSPVLLWGGKNASLQEERATSHTLGIEIRPDFLAGSSFALTYFDVRFEDRIQRVPISGTWLLEPRFASLVTRDPTPQQRQTVCSRSVFAGAISDCLSAPVAAIVDVRLQNTSVSEVSGIDLLANYNLQTGLGDIGMQLNGSYLFDFSQALTDHEPLLDLRNTPGNPIDLRLRGSLSWRFHKFGATAFVNYADSYKDTVSEPDRRITSWTTADVQLAYDTGDGTGFFDLMNLSLNIQNIFDEEAPFFNNPIGVGYDPENVDLMGRFVSLQLGKRW